MKNPSTTDIASVLGELNAGVLEQQINRAISDVALNSVTHGGKGHVILRLDFKQIGQSSQVVVKHTLTHRKPTMRGSVVEVTAAETPMHVGAGGTLSVTPHDQTDMFNTDKPKVTTGEPQ